ncbi:MAG TPA: aminotransferase class I/II-fold pyridoxal phosphate-dependent enzyme [Syntrophorhabdales bacterium]|nr:aminotransferase class I/II-fold pyridoxal phosphate-dependent enzyme [Syntrophorhabdales bacterium]
MKRTGAHRILDFTFITNPIGPSNKARHAVRKAIRTLDRVPETRFLTRYLCSTEVIAEEQLLLGNGASHILTLLLQTLTPPSALLPSPVPHAYEETLQKQQVEVRPFPLDLEQDFKISKEKFKDCWRDADAAFILNPHNPTGTVLPEDLIVDLIRTSAELGKPLIIDETLRDFTDSPSQAQQVIQASNVIILRTFSFYHALAGLRLGYAIGHPALLSRIRQLMGPRPLNSLAPFAALASLRDKGYRRRTAAYLSAETAYALKKLQGLEWIKPLATPWGFLLRIQPAIADLKNLFFAKALLVDEYGDAQGNQYLSFPFRSHPENAQFFRVLQRILREQNQRQEGRPLR